jgi:hypothetical protein
VTIRDEILEGVRAWFIAAIPEITNEPATAAAPNQIIPEDSKGPRPAPPYLTVKVSAADTPDGVDEHRHADDGVGGVEWRSKGERGAVVDVQGFDTHGATTTAGWIEDAVLRLTRPDVAAVLDAAGLSVVNRGSTLDVSALLDTEIERRHLRSFELRYAVRDAAAAGVELETVEAVFEFRHRDGDPDPLPVEIEIDTT